MKFVFGFLLIICSLCGLAISFLGDITVNSTLVVINEVDLTTALLAFSLVALINGLFIMFLNN